jgi:hypothetical protein
VLEQGISRLTSTYEERFKSIFPIPPSYPANNHSELEDFSKAITANLLGGVGYFYGTSIVNNKFSYEWDEDTETNGDVPEEEKGSHLTEPRELLTATPSRSFFPRGFYWYVYVIIFGKSPVNIWGIGTKVSICFILVNGITISGDRLHLLLTYHRC